MGSYAAVESDGRSLKHIYITTVSTVLLIKVTQEEFELSESCGCSFLLHTGQSQLYLEVFVQVPGFSTISALHGEK